MNKNLTKKILKYRIQKDWTAAFTITSVLISLKLFKEIGWAWIWLLSPLWILLSVYLVCTIFALIYGHFYNKNKRAMEKWESMSKSECGKYCISPKDCECFKSLKI